MEPKEFLFEHIYNAITIKIMSYTEKDAYKMLYEMFNDSRNDKGYLNKDCFLGPGKEMG